MAASKYGFCHIAQRTDVGCQRHANEDWLDHFESPNGLVAVVCDGMGGHVGGQEASHTAVAAIREFMMKKSELTPQQLIVKAMDVANKAILHKVKEHPELTGMGATCVMVLVSEDGKVYIGSIGDSRVYLNRGRQLIQLTKDQSYVQTLVDAGLLTPAEAECHPRKNEITNALGLPEMRPATVLADVYEPEAGDCFILCSDGLSGMVSDADICGVISRKTDMTQQKRVDTLIELARKNGGLDNITCQAVEFTVRPDEYLHMISQQNTMGDWWHSHRRSILLGVAIFLAGVLVSWLFRKRPAQQPDNAPGAVAQKPLDATDSVQTLTSSIFASNCAFLDITEDSENGSLRLITAYGDSSDTLTLTFPLSLQTLEVTPSAKVNVVYLDAERKHCVLAYADDFDGATEVTVRMTGEAPCPSYTFIVPVETSLPESTAIVNSQPEQTEGTQGDTKITN